MRRVEIVRAPALELAGVPHRGDYSEIGGAFGRMHEIMQARALYRDGQHNVAVYFDDVAVTPAAARRGFAGRTVGPEIPVEKPLERMTLPAGEYAILRHLGPYAGLGASYGWLIGVWLLQSGRVAATAPCYEVYRNTPMDAAPGDLITDIHLPLA